MEILRYVDIGKSKWDEYVTAIPNITFEMSSAYVEFICAHTDDFIANESFVLQLDNRIVGLSILCIEKRNNENYISWGGRPCLAPLLTPELEYKFQEKQLRSSFVYINNLADQYQIKKSSLELDPMLNPQYNLKLYNYNYLMKYGYFDDSDLMTIWNLPKLDGLVVKEKILDESVIQAQSLDLQVTIVDSDYLMMEENSILYKKLGSLTCFETDNLFVNDYAKLIKQGIAFITVVHERNRPLLYAVSTFSMKTAKCHCYVESKEDVSSQMLFYLFIRDTVHYLKKQKVNFYAVPFTLQGCIRSVLAQTQEPAVYYLPHYKGIWERCQRKK